MRSVVPVLFVVAIIPLVYSGAPGLGRAQNNSEDDECLTIYEAIFPYPSSCYLPATYNYTGRGAYYIQASGISTGYRHFLAPEWDPENSTYYVRLADAYSTDTPPAKYVFTHTAQEFRPFVSMLNTDIIIVNVDTRRALKWRDQGGEHLLVEADIYDDTTSLVLFQFKLDLYAFPPCPLSLKLHCPGYDIVSGSDSSTGVAAHVENDTVYFKLATENHVPFILIEPVTGITSLM